MNSSHRLSSARRLPVLAALAVAALGFAGSLKAQVAVTSLTWGTTQNGPDSSVKHDDTKLIFENTFTTISSVSTASQTYFFDASPMAQQVVLRRSSSDFTDNYYLVRDATKGGDDKVYTFAPPPASPSSVLTSGNVNFALADPFKNGSAQGNVERIDLYLGNYTVQANDAVVLFDIENTGDHGDSYRVAAFNGWGASSTPTSYVNTGLLVYGGSYGQALSYPDGDPSHTIMQAGYSKAGSLTSLDTEMATGNLVGLVIRLSDLGLVAGQVIQGISLLPSDVYVTKASDLLNWTAFPDKAVPGTVPNDIDFAGFSGRIGRPIPEPAAYGAVLTALGLGFVAALRRRRASGVHG